VDSRSVPGADAAPRQGNRHRKKSSHVHLNLPQQPDFVAELAAVPEDKREVIPDNDPRRRSRFGLRRMFARDPKKHERAASPLELFFDLVFAAAVGIASETLFDMEESATLLRSTAAFLMVFFTIWLAWDSYTWFSSAFDTDDWLYRVCTFVQMAGVLVLAAGIEPAMRDFDFGVGTVGYVVMRLAMVFQWLRAAVSSPWYREPALKQAAAMTIVQILWVARWLWFDDGIWLFVSFVALAALEIAIPYLAQAGTKIPWHPHHVAERYSLFTLIVLGESIIASANAMIEAIHATEDIRPLILISVSDLVIAAGMWWVYFSRYQRSDIQTFRRAHVFGYVHYVIYVSIAAFSAGLELLISSVEESIHLSPTWIAATVSAPVTVFLITVWSSFLRKHLSTGCQIGFWTGILVVGLSPLAQAEIIVTAVGVMISVVFVEVSRVAEFAAETRKQTKKQAK
jgi:low temperature requirement protein LtrA